MYNYLILLDRSLNKIIFRIMLKKEIYLKKNI